MSFIKTNVDQLTTKIFILKEELEMITAENVSLAIEDLNYKNALIQEYKNDLNYNTALIQEYVINLIKQDNEIISLKQTCKYLQEELNKKDLATSNNLDEKTLNRLHMKDLATSNDLDKQTLNSLYKIGL
ncbi:33117_t:CDS:2 [Gigaspora margarita]|uniref:33117_t:CDS:1 n=1 Tax=Gigaspora margarita TaxID=4874 RepID=A0ABN7UXT0_GIGMA|nr:33117_t:CDS:2 [Gigaspora margarita]